jgi:hypothetical protein
MIRSCVCGGGDFVSDFGGETGVETRKTRKERKKPTHQQGSKIARELMVSKSYFVAVYLDKSDRTDCFCPSLNVHINPSSS